jgi:type II secretory pathway pseudopilin PulG
MISQHRSTRRVDGFTVVELLVVVGIIVTIIAILLPALSGVRRSSRITADLANLRSLQTAQLAYATDHNGFLADARLPHGGVNQGWEESFVTTLAPYFGNNAALRSPLDESPHWALDAGGEGVPVPGTSPASVNYHRLTSYGINNYLAREFSPQAAIDPTRVADRLSKIASPSDTVHMLLMTETGPYAGSDHPHVEEWGALGQAPLVASSHVDTAAAGGLMKTGDARSDWSFLDGHVATLRFNEVYIDETVNRFDPGVSALFQRRVQASGS